MIKMATTLTFVTTRCFGGRHDDREIVYGEREGLDMNGEERARTDKEREREREGRMKKNERCVQRGRS